MRKILNKIVRYFGYILFRPIWWLERLVPRSKNIWVFGAWYGQKYSDNSKWLYEYVLEHNPEIKAVWITKNRDVYKKLQFQNKLVAMSTSFKGAWWCLRAKYALLTSAQLDVNRFFLNGCKQVWLWHGMPLKKILNCADELLSVSKFHKTFSNIFNPYQRFNPYVTLTSSSFFTKFLEPAFSLPRTRILETGLPRCDVFFTNKKEKYVEDLRKEFKDSKIFLYMPTFRMSSRMDGTPFNPFVQKFGFSKNEFTKFLEEQNIVFLFKPHFVDSDVSIENYSKRFICLDDNYYEDLYVLLNSVDYLITDYSSVFFDFISTKKPIFLLTFDYNEYISNSRSHFFNMKDEMTGIVCNNWNEFYSSYEENRWNKINFSRNNKFSEFLDGNSCKKLVHELRKR